MVDIERALIKRFWPPWNDGKLDGDLVWAPQLTEEAAERKLAAQNGTP